MDPPLIVVVFWEVKVTETLQPPPHNTYYHLQSSIAVVPMKIIVVIFQVGSLVVPAMTKLPRPPQLLQPPPPQSVEAFLEVKVFFHNHHHKNLTIIHKEVFLEVTAR